LKTDVDRKKKEVLQNKLVQMEIEKKKMASRLEFLQNFQSKLKKIPNFFVKKT